MIIDATIFAGELDMLEFRMKILGPLVDWFVVVEDTKTHQGTPREWTLKDTKLPKVIPYLTDVPMGEDSRAVEIGQREATVAACERFSDQDVLIMSDVDEIPSREAVHWAAEHPNLLPAGCELDSFYYRLNHRRIERLRLVISTVGHLRSIGGENLSRNCRISAPILDGCLRGWHFSFFGGTKRIQDKLRSYGHPQFNAAEFLDEAWLEKCQRDGIGLLKCNTKFDRVGNEFFPKYVVENAPESWWL